MKKYFKEVITHPLFSGSAIMVIGSNSINVVNYLYHLIMGRLLGPSAYGELAVLITLIGLLGVIPGSLSLVIIKYVSSAKTDQDIDDLISWLRAKIFQLSLIFFFVITAMSPFIKSFLHINKTIYIILIAATFLFSLPTLLNRSVLQGLLKFKEMVLSVLIESGSKLIVSILLVYLGYRVGGAMAAFTLSAAIGWYLTNIYLKTHIKGNPKRPSNIKAMILYTIPVFLQYIALTSLYSSDVVLVKHFFSSHDAGIYASLSTLGKIIFFGTGPIGAVMFPLISHKKSRGGEYRKIFLFSFLATSIFALGVLAIYWLFPQLAINLLYGSAFLEATHLLVWFGIFIFLYTLSALLINFNLSLGETKIVVFPLLAALVQVIAIWFYHQTLFMVVMISISVTALLLGLLLIYSSRINPSPEMIRGYPKGTSLF